MEQSWVEVVLGVLSALGVGGTVVHRVKLQTERSHRKTTDDRHTVLSEHLTTLTGIVKDLREEVWAASTNIRKVSDDIRDLADAHRDTHKQDTERLESLRSTYEERTQALNDRLFAVKLGNTTGNLNPVLQSVLKGQAPQRALTDFQLPGDGPPLRVPDAEPAREPTGDFGEMFPGDDDGDDATEDLQQP